MVSIATINHIVEDEISRAGLDPVTANRLRAWASAWSDAFRSEREYSERAVRTMARNAASFYAAGGSR